MQDTNTASDSGPTTKQDRLSTVFVACVWLLMVLWVTLFVKSHTANVPIWDEWMLVPYVTGNQPITLEHLWGQHNEHRIPLPRIVHYALAKIFHPDFRATTYLDLLLVASLALGMIAAARHLRGRTSYRDAFFPLTILSLGQTDTLVCGFQLALVLTPVLSGMILWAILKNQPERSWWQILGTALCLVCLPLCGMPGVILATFLAIWFAVAGIVQWRLRDRFGTWRGATMIILAIASLTICCMYFINYRSPSHHPPCPSFLAGVKSTLQFLCMSLGPAAGAGWPFFTFDPRTQFPTSGWAWWGIAMAVLVIATFVILVIALWRQRETRLRSTGLLLFLLAACALSGAIGWGRAGLWDNYVLGRNTYMTLSLLVPCAIYFAWERFAFGTAARWVQTALCVLMILFAPGNTERAVDYGKVRYELQKSVEHALRAGASAEAIAAQYGPPLGMSREQLIPRLEMLRKAGIGKFRFMAPVEQGTAETARAVLAH